MSVERKSAKQHYTRVVAKTTVGNKCLSVKLHCSKLFYLNNVNLLFCTLDPESASYNCIAKF